MSVVLRGGPTRAREQFGLDLDVRNRTNAASQDVINIRACTAQVDVRVTVDPSLAEAGEDPLNFPIRLNDKIAALHGVIESVDGKPTDQTFQVFDELNAQLQVQLQKLRDIVSADVAAFNALLQNPISCAAVQRHKEA
jgi:hypothetical protein